jgi:hypothetical protein
MALLGFTSLLRHASVTMKMSIPRNILTSTWPTWTLQETKNFGGRQRGGEPNAP